jgi:hypothetical protein
MPHYVLASKVRSGSAHNMEIDDHDVLRLRSAQGGYVLPLFFDRSSSEAFINLFAGEWQPEARNAFPVEMNPIDVAFIANRVEDAPTYVLWVRTSSSGGLDIFQPIPSDEFSTCLALLWKALDLVRANTEFDDDEKVRDLACDLALEAIRMRNDTQEPGPPDADSTVA